MPTRLDEAKRMRTLQLGLQRTARLSMLDPNVSPDLQTKFREAANSMDDTLNQLGRILDELERG